MIRNNASIQTFRSSSFFFLSHDLNARARVVCADSPDEGIDSTNETAFGQSLFGFGGQGLRSETKGL
jgi:hypothetical protein